MSADTAAYAPLVDGIEIHCPAYFVACACVKGKKFFSMNAFPWMYAEPTDHEHRRLARVACRA